ncbi:MAG: tetratricopeptide repeat protein [Fervidobacterium sp.]
MIIRLILGSMENFVIDIDEETPILVILRDIFYSGDWKNLMKDLEEVEELNKKVETLEKLEERIVSLNEIVYEPVVWTEVAEFLEKYRLTPENMVHATADGLYELAIEYADKNATDIAKDILKFAIKLDKNYAPAYEFYGSLLLEEGDIEGAIKYLNRSIELDPWLIQSYSMIGEAYYNMGKYEKAIEYWEKEISLSPSNTFTYFMISDAYTKVGKIDKAIEILEKFRENSENSIIALYELAELYRKAGNEDKAKEYESLIMEIDPQKDPNGIEIWAKVHLKKGNYDKVISVVENVINSIPEAKHLNLVLAVAYIKTNQIEKAKRVVEELKDDNFWYLYGKREFFDELLTNSEKELCGIK